MIEGKVNNIYKNQKFFITLEENTSTGYSWSYKTSAKTVKLTNANSSDESSMALVEGKDNTVKLGQKFSVSLGENTTTGYSWSYSIEGNVISLSE